METEKYTAFMLPFTIDVNESIARQPASAITQLNAVIPVLWILSCQGQIISNAVHVLAHGLIQLPGVQRRHAYCC